MNDLSIADQEISTLEIMSWLPHRWPFLMIDRASHFRPLESIRAYKAVTATETHFQGHFPARPIMPGVLIIEAMAQAGGLLIAKSRNLDIAKHACFLVGVDGARFRKPIEPGVMIEFDVSISGHKFNIYRLRGEARVGGKLAAEAEFAVTRADMPGARA